MPEPCHPLSGVKGQEGQLGHLPALLEMPHTSYCSWGVERTDSSRGVAVPNIICLLHLGNKMELLRVNSRARWAGFKFQFHPCVNSDE